MAILAGSLLVGPSAHAATPHEVDATTAAHVTIQGVAGEGVSAAEPVGDVNGDGRTDIAVNAFNADHNGRTDAGAVYVVFGQASMTNVDLGNLGSNGFVINGAAAADWVGDIAPAGDLNGDGKADLLIGAYNASPSGRTYAGSSYVVYGTASTTAVDLNALGSGGWRISGGAAGDKSGYRLDSTPDMNGDGKREILITAPRVDTEGGSRTDGGVTYVIFGKAGSVNLDLSALGSAGFIVEGGAALDEFGDWVSSVGDVNGDGKGDMIIGARFAGNNGRAYSGSAYVIYGKSTTTTIDVANLGAKGYRIDGATTYDCLGYAVNSAGDVNGDGIQDFAIGADYASYNGRNQSGSAYVIFGSATPGNIDLATLGSKGFRIDGAAADDNFGTGITPLGDINGDGRGDLLAGAPGNDYNGKTDAGVAYVIFGRTTTALPIDLASLGTQGYIIGGGTAGDQLGYETTSRPADFNGDGYADPMVLAYGAAPSGRTGAGATYVLDSDTTPPTSSVSQTAGTRPDLQYFDSASNTLFYRPAATGTFTLGNTPADTGSGVSTVDFPALATTGFSASATQATAAPWQSGTYTFTSANTTAPASQPVVVTDGSGNRTTTTVAFNRDVTGPTTSITGVPTKIANGQALTASATDAGSGTMSVAFQYCAGATCAWGTGTAIGSADSSAPYTAGWASQPADGQYTVVARATDRVGNTSDATQTVTLDNTGPTGAALGTTAVTGAGAHYFNPGSSTLFYNPNPGGSFKVTATASDPAGIGSVDFPTLSDPGFTGTAATSPTAPYTSSTYTFSSANTTAPASKSVTFRDALGNSTTKTLSFSRDVTGPPVSVTAGATVHNGDSIGATSTDAGSGTASVAFKYCAGATCSWGSGTAIGTADSSAPYGVAWSSQPADGTYTVLARSTDNVGNTTDATRTLTVDNTGPGSTAFSVTEVSGQSFQSFDAAAGRLFYNPLGGSGSFSLSATASDPAGVAAVAFPAVSSTGFSGSAASPASSPFDSSTYSFTGANTAAPANATVSFHDSLGNTSTRTLAFTRDVTGPVAAGTTPAAIKAGQPVSATATDGGAGTQSVAFGYCSSSPCTWASATAIGGPDANAPYATNWTGQPADGNYTLVARAADAVGNATDSQETVRVDNTGPSGAALGTTAVTGADAQYFDAASQTLFFSPTAAGSFRLTGSATDPSGMGSVAFPAISDTGFTGAALSDAGSPFSSNVYSFDTSSAAAPSPQTVTFKDALGNASAQSVSFDRDATPPSGGSISYADGTVSGPIVPITTSPGSDAGAGISPSGSVVQRTEAPFDGSACGAFSSAWTAVASPDDSATPGNCYRYRYVETDRVGNATIYTSSATVQRPATAQAPLAPSGSGSGSAGTTATTPEAPTTPPRIDSENADTAQVRGTAGAAPVRIVTKSVAIDRRGRATLKVRCGSRTRCRGRYSLFYYVTTKPKHAKKGHAKASISAARRRKKVVIGKGRINVKAGAAGKIVVHISRKGRRQILRKRRQRCRISTTVNGRSQTRSITVKTPKTKHKPRVGHKHH